MEEDQPLDVLIIGAGLAGLAAAIALGKQGHRVVIIEKSSFLRETGAAIHLPPNCTALLTWMGIDPKEFGGTLLHEIHTYRFDGSLKFKKEFADVRSTWQDEWYLVHRVDLHNHLKTRAMETADLHTGCKITSIDVNSSRPSITLDDGRTFEADLLLGADGLHSQVRGAIAPSAPAPYKVGKACFRWLLPTEDLQKHESTQEFVKESGIFIEWAADDRRLVAYPCSNSKVYNLCAFAPSEEMTGDTQADGWQTSGDKETIVRIFSEFAPGVQKIVESADDKLKLGMLLSLEMQRIHFSHVSLSNENFVDLLHSDVEYYLLTSLFVGKTDMGQGGAMAIEDAVGIATLLPVGIRKNQISDRLKMYESIRRPRVEFVLEYTRLNGRDENDSASARITPAEMVRVMGICFSYNEIDHCRKILGAQ
ncbi:hypothetical protein N7456_006202 [Penicillium angulare]|uniref:FAD-binding domain-containing protein n=1 Tax=Penicillium angulare TaxID=116970 RepID=A0A9W9FZZ8_9EURO|nr:hypothetical protein N7456_006202 [Penicillium angulare]